MGVGVSGVPAYDRLGNAGGVRKWRRRLRGMVMVFCLTVQTLHRAHAKTFGNL